MQANIMCLHTYRVRVKLLPVLPMTFASIQQRWQSLTAKHTFSKMLLSRKAQAGFKKLLHFGCYTKLIPYNWNHITEQLSPTTVTGNFMFNIHKNVTCLHTFFCWCRTVQSYLQGQFSLLGLLWTLSNTVAVAAVITLHVYKENILYFTNRILTEGGFNPAATQKLRDQDDLQRRIDIAAVKMLSRHMLFNLFLFFTNPEIHIFIVGQNPCAPNFISSLFFKCGSIFDNSVDLVEKVPFLVFEFYTTVKWQFECSLQLSLIFLGLGYLTTELRHMERAL